MSMYSKNKKGDAEREFFGGLFAIICHICLCATPAPLLVGLVSAGIITGIVAMVSGVIMWVIAPEEYKK